MPTTFVIFVILAKNILYEIQKFKDILKQTKKSNIYFYFVCFVL